ncbi:hypothetical protein C0992_006968 [Termitomyces sp. T32_za158]|nr:hypothetical protein C0992_006968 [Termitomyces sp. T32_za158]
MDSSDNISSSFDDTEGQPFVWDQHPDDTSDSSEDLPPAHAYLDEISSPINEDWTPSVTSTGSRDPIPGPDTSGSVQAYEQGARSGSPLSSQPSNIPSPTKSTKSHSYSGLSKGSGAEARPSSRTSMSSGRRSSSRHSENGETRRRVNSPSWHGSEILASSGIAWKETQELREKLARSLAINDALQKDVKRLEQSLQNEKDKAEKAELEVKDERRLAREALQKAELKAQSDVKMVEQMAMRESEKAEARFIRAEAAADQERKRAREAVEKVEAKAERAEAAAVARLERAEAAAVARLERAEAAAVTRVESVEAATVARVERAEARAEKAETRAWQAVDKAETNAKEKEEYRVKALMAEAEVRELKEKLAKYERARK